MQTAQQCIVITGAGQGLGRALAVLAASRGYDLALVGRTLSKLDESKVLLERAGLSANQKVTTHQIDLTESQQVENGFSNIFDQHENIFGLVNNAGTWIGRQEIADLKKSDFTSALDLNFFSAFEPTQFVLKNHRSKNSLLDNQLSVIFVGATASLSGRKSLAPFSLSKVAMRAFAQALAREVGPQGVHVAHIILDGVLDNERTFSLNPASTNAEFMKQSEVAKTILQVMEQDRSCWTFELDLRPFCEKW